MKQDLPLAGVVAALMLAAAIAGTVLTPRDMLAAAPGRQPLAALVPASFGGWREATNARLVPPTPDVQQALARTYDDTFARAYRAADGRLVMLSISYGRSQRGDGILHRPEVCYAGQGFAVRPWGGAEPLAAGPRRIAVTRLMTEGPRHEPVTYWLVVGTRVVRFGMDWRLATLRHGLRGEVADGVLVRVSSLDADPERAFALQARFVQDLAASLSGSAADRLLGELP